MTRIRISYLKFSEWQREVVVLVRRGVNTTTIDVWVDPAVPVSCPARSMMSSRMGKADKVVKIGAFANFVGLINAETFVLSEEHIGITASVVG